MLQFPGWMKKNFIPWNFSWRVLVETWDASYFKKCLMEKQQCFKHITIENDIFSELNRCIFQISLKYIKLVVPILIFTSKQCYPAPPTSPTKLLLLQCNPTPNKIKISHPFTLQQKNFSKIFNAPSPSWRWGRGCMPW